MSTGPKTDYSLLISALALFGINSPLNHWWSTLTLPWYSLFVPWILIIALIAWNQQSLKRGN